MAGNIRDWQLGRPALPGPDPSGRGSPRSRMGGSDRSGHPQVPLVKGKGVQNAILKRERRESRVWPLKTPGWGRITLNQTSQPQPFLTPRWLRAPGSAPELRSGQQLLPSLRCQASIQSWGWAHPAG